MPEELETDLLDERKFEQWMNKQNFGNTLEKVMRFAEETKEQFAEKIPELSGKMESVTSEVKDVEIKLGIVDDRLSTVDKSIGTLCAGIDCIKEDVKKFQVSQDSLEKLVQESIPALSKNMEDTISKIKDIETKLSTVDDRLSLSTVDDGLNAIDKSIGTLCAGIDCIKEDVKKFQVSQDSIEKLLQKDIPVLSRNMENVTGKIRGIEAKLSTVDDRLDMVDKSIGIFCTGIDYIIEDVKKFQVSQGSLEKLIQEKYQTLCGDLEKSHDNLEKLEQERYQTLYKDLEKLEQERYRTLYKDLEKLVQEKYQTLYKDLEKLVQEKYQTLCKDLEKPHDTLENLVQERFEELGEKVQSLENPTFICENCGEKAIVPLSSYCPNCGSEIQSWSDENGQPAKGWIPYWKR